MPELHPVAERLERRLCGNLAAAFDLAFDASGLDKDATLQRAHPDGNNAPTPPAGLGLDPAKPPLWAIVHFGEADIADGDDDGFACGVTSYVLDLDVEVHLTGPLPREDPDGPDDDATNPTLHPRAWAHRVQTTILQTLQADDGQLPEDGPGTASARLCTGLDLRGTYGPIIKTNNRDTEAGVEAILRFRHAEDDPYTLG
ncbi:MAG: hypothetical protein AAGF84_10830 [Planctomycetota bacterium]